MVRQTANSNHHNHHHITLGVRYAPRWLIGDLCFTEEGD